MSQKPSRFTPHNVITPKEIKDLLRLEGEGERTLIFMPADPAAEVFPLLRIKLTAPDKLEIIENKFGLSVHESIRHHIRRNKQQADA